MWEPDTLSASLDCISIDFLCCIWTKSSSEPPALTKSSSSAKFSLATTKLSLPVLAFASTFREHERNRTASLHDETPLFLQTFFLRNCNLEEGLEQNAIAARFLAPTHSIVVVNFVVVLRLSNYHYFHHGVEEVTASKLSVKRRVVDTATGFF